MAAVTSAGARSWEGLYFEGYFAELVRGEVGPAERAYATVMEETGQIDPVLAARAALRLAELRARAGARRDALELLARARALGQRDPDVIDWADRLQARLGPLRGTGSGVRGPPVGTVPEEMTPEAREKLARAERLLATYLRTPLKPRLEGLNAQVRAKERALEAAARAYREVVASGDPLGVQVAEVRIATVYHDVALALVFGLPPELEPREAARRQRRLRQRAVGHLRTARAAYRRALAIEAAPDASERWHRAARTGLAAVEDLLRGS